MVPSAPAAANEHFGGYPIFERVRRPTVGSRRCSPAANSFVAIDRVLATDRPALLLRRAHSCTASWALAEDLLERSLGPVGMQLLDAFSEPDGQINVVIEGCPGVRLRAIAEACASRGQLLPREVVWHLVDRTASLRAAWARVGLAPGDTFVGFDGSLHFFPRLDACARAEAPSYMGDEVWDAFVADAEPTSLAQLVCGRLPDPFLAAARDAALREAGIAIPERPVPETPHALTELLAQPRTQMDATDKLAALARELFPEDFLRHQDVYARCKMNLDEDGRAREAAVRAAGAKEYGPTPLRIVGPRHVAGLPWNQAPRAALAAEVDPVRCGQLRRVLGPSESAKGLREDLPDDAIATDIPRALAEAYAQRIGRRVPSEQRSIARTGFRCVFDIRPPEQERSR